MELERTAARVWRRLTRDEKLAAARFFWAQPPEESLALANQAVVRMLHVRPKMVRKLPVESRALALAGVTQPDELLAAALLVALHLGDRRPLLGAFLEGVGLAHDEGLMPEDAPTDPIDAEAARRGYDAVRGAFPEEQVWIYLNTLWLQDNARWAVIEEVVKGA